MKICSNNHEEVSFNAEVCPMCDIIRKNKCIPVKVIMDEMDNDLKNLESWWQERICANVVSSEERLDTLLRLVESVFIGQTGGYDNGQTVHTLRARYEWLKKKLETK